MLRRRWPREGQETSPETIALADEAWEEIGHFYDVVLDDEAAARMYFERAARLRETREC